MSYGILGRQLRRMDKEQKRQAAFVSNPAEYEFRVAPSCPPDLCLHMRGGFMWGAPGAVNAGAGWFVEPITIDFTDTDQVGWNGQFTNAYWYRGVAVTLRQGALPPGFTQEINLYTTTNERETSAEAENDVMDELVTIGPWLSDYPLCIVIFRNNGIVSMDSQLEPIDAVNRQRSYYWRDLRPRHMVNT